MEGRSTRSSPNIAASDRAFRGASRSAGPVRDYAEIEGGARAVPRRTVAARARPESGAAVKRNAATVGAGRSGAKWETCRGRKRWTWKKLRGDVASDGFPSLAIRRSASAAGGDDRFVEPPSRDLAEVDVRYLTARVGVEGGVYGRPHRVDEEGEHER